MFSYPLQHKAPRNYDLNDFKSIEGDKQFGVNSLPVKLGEKLAQKLAASPCCSANIVTLFTLWQSNFWDFL